MHAVVVIIIGELLLLICTLLCFQSCPPGVSLGAFSVRTLKNTVGFPFNLSFWARWMVV